MLLSQVLQAAEEGGNPLPVVSGVFPLIALGVFAILGAVTWSYRDVANRHAGRGSTGRDSGH